METRRKSVAKKGATSGIIQKGKMDIGFFALVTTLLTIGLLMLFSSSYAYALAYFGDSYHFIKKQALFAIVGFVLMMLISKINYHIYRRFAWVIYIISAIMLLALLILPPMVEGATQKRWMVIGPIN
ncbi:MAG: FtsW/RodA/SpoVE family cell cycle protein, partial [Clostridia bacterium]|nr:FtsW/RodA/SpoVE family cell cycle protein [Clostridia bacterium]